MQCGLGDREDDETDTSDEDGNEDPPETVLPPTRGGSAAVADYRKNKQETAPANYHSLGEIVYDSFSHFVQAGFRIDTTPGDGLNACDSIAQGMPYVGLCQTDAQMKFIEDMVFKRVLTEMSNPSNKACYSASYAKWKGSVASASTAITNAPEAHVVVVPNLKKAKIESSPAASGPPALDATSPLAKMIAASKAMQEDK